MSSRWKVKYPKAASRALLSDVLPHETPIFFSNEGFYSFVQENLVSCVDGIVRWKAGSSSLNKVIRFLFNLGQQPLKPSHIVRGRRRIVACKLVCQSQDAWISEPYEYVIRHGQEGHRTISIMHPRNQMLVVDFYRKYDYALMQLCSESSFTLRRPLRIAREQKSARGNYYLKKPDAQNVTSLRSYYSYAPFDLVSLFWDSELFVESEHQFRILQTMDIQHCFGSIYTHSIVWSVFGKEFTKNNVSEVKKASLPGHFDKLMQHMNYNESYGILIGPEVSRLFAEVLLQGVDRKVEDELKSADLPLLHKADYRIFRYLDDYFIFCSDEEQLELIVNSLDAQLKEIKLLFNKSKTLKYVDPIVSKHSFAKKLVSALINEVLPLDFFLPASVMSADDDNQEVCLTMNQHRISFVSSVKEFKLILLQSNMQYEDVVNYFLAGLESRLETLIRKVISLGPSKEFSEGHGLSNSEELMRLLFFVYSKTEGVSEASKVCRLIFLLHTVVTSLQVHPHYSDSFKLLLRRLIVSHLKLAKSFERIRIEHGFFLSILAQLVPRKSISSREILKLFPSGLTDRRKSPGNLDYFTIVTVLYFITDDEEYAAVRYKLELAIIEKLSHPIKVSRCSELTMLFLDSLTCPWISLRVKRVIVAAVLGKEAAATTDELLALRKNWFVTWTDLDLAKQFETRRLTSVY